MRSAAEVESFRALAEGKSADAQTAYKVACYEACIPKSFWDVSSRSVTHNQGVFRSAIMKYCANRKKAQRNGYSLILIGDNGVGKTMFISYVLTQMIKRGCTAYYTTLAQLDIDIKRGFKDHAGERRLTELLDADFVAVDELGKEHYRSDSYLMTQLELLLKRRYDDGDPMLLASNLDYEKLRDMYGPSMSSMFDGKYHVIQLESGDFRRSIAARMRKDMGF